MDQTVTLKTALKRGALVAAANWPVVVIQFVAESTFKLLLVVPIVGGVFLVALRVRRDLVDLLSGDLRDILATIASGLVAEPVAFGAFLFALLLVVLGGSAFTFLIKGGTVSVLADGDQGAEEVDAAAFLWPAFRAAGRFSTDRFVFGASRLFRRYLRLGLLLIAVYAVSGTLYLLVVFGGYRVIGDRALLVGWTLVAALLSSMLIVWITTINLLYLLTQIVVAVADRGVFWSFREVLRFLRADLWDVIGVFGIVLGLIVVATGASIGATLGLGLIAVVPLIGVVVLPLQLGAWLLRNLVFQYLGLTALAAYLHLYRHGGGSHRATAREPAPIDQRHSSTDEAHG
jgi:hypothetical protein